MMGAVMLKRHRFVRYPWGWPKCVRGGVRRSPCIVILKTQNERSTVLVFSRGSLQPNNNLSNITRNLFIKEVVTVERQHVRLAIIIVNFKNVHREITKTVILSYSEFEY